MPSRKNSYWPRTIGYFAVFVAVGLETAALGPTLTGLAEHTNTHLDAVSLLHRPRAGLMSVPSLAGGTMT